MNRKYNWEYGRFNFIATKRTARIFSAAMLVIYMTLCVAATFGITWVIGKLT